MFTVYYKFMFCNCRTASL